MITKIAIIIIIIIGIIIINNFLFPHNYGKREQLKILLAL